MISLANQVDLVCFFHDSEMTNYIMASITYMYDQLYLKTQFKIVILPGTIKLSVCVLVLFNVAFNNFSVILRWCLVVTGSSILTFKVLDH